MNLRRLMLCLALALTTVAGHAQIGIYGKFDATRVSSGDISFVSNGWYSGPGAGIYYDFLHLGPIALGADLRGDLQWGNQQKYRSALFGVRLAVKPPMLPIRPYVQGSVGAGGPTHSGLNGVGSIYSTKFQYQVLGGVDYTIFPHIDWRVAEVGYVRMTGISSGGAAPATNLLTIGTGIVFRLP